MNLEERIIYTGNVYKTVDVLMNGVLLGCYDDWVGNLGYSTFPRYDVWPVGGRFLATDKLDDVISWLINERNRLSAKSDPKSD